MDCNIPTETILKNLRMKIEIIKENNKIYFRKKKRTSSLFHELPYKRCCLTRKDVQKKSNNFIDDEEIATVDSCFRKSIALIKHKKYMKKLNKSSSSCKDCSFFKHNIVKSMNAAINPLKEIEIITVPNVNTSKTSLFPHMSQNNHCKHVDQSVFCLENETSLNYKKMTNNTRKNDAKSAITVMEKEKISQKPFEITEIDNVNNTINVKTKKNLYDKVLQKSLDSLTHSKKKVLKKILNTENMNESIDSSFQNNNFETDAIETISLVDDENTGLDSTLSNFVNNAETTSIDKISSSQLYPEIYISDDEVIEISDDISDEINDDISNDEIVEISDNISDPILPILDFNEEPVDFVVPEHHLEEKVSHMPKEKIDKLLSEGVIKVGTWSKKEKALLERNYFNFTTQFKINDARLLFGIGRRGSSNRKENALLKKFLKAKHFLLRLGKDLNNRTLNQIYYYARFYFDPLRKGNKLSSSQISLILRLQRKYGNQWQLISKKTGVPAILCQACCYNLKNFKRGTLGKWTDKEKEILLAAIRKVSNCSDLSNKDLKGISWTRVSNIVGNRNQKQCLRMWHMHLAKQQNPGIYQKWDEKCTEKLISLLKRQFLVNDEADINWMEVYKYLKDVAPSLYFLKTKLKTLKTHIPKNIKHNYSDTINFLFKKYCSDSNYK